MDFLESSNQCFTFSFITFFQKWQDSRLKWEEKDYNDLKTISFGASEIWKPDITLMNSLDTSKSAESLYIRVNSIGTAIWAPSFTIRVQCPLDLVDYPFDEQVCLIYYIGFTIKAIQFVPLKSKFLSFIFSLF